jgi:hypothetical protein
MKRIASILFGIVFLAGSAPAQERKIEITPFAGGYFSAGFQSVKLVQWGPSAVASGPGIITLTPQPLPVRDLKPVDEPNSGIFGVRASYDLSRRFTLEGTFGFSPAGREFTALSPRIILAQGLLPQPQPTPPQPVSPQPGQVGSGNPEGSLVVRPIPFPIPFIRGKDTFHYSGNVLFRWPGARGWSPFITGGLGAVTRTAEVSSPIGRIIPYLTLQPPSGTPSGAPIVAPIAASIFIPAPIDTDLAVNFGGGVKKYFSSRCGIRFDFRDYVSKVDEDTVHNLEASLGVIFRF